MMRRFGLLLALLLALGPRAWADGPGSAPEAGPPPLFSGPPTNDADFDTYLHFTRLRHGSRTVLLVWGQIIGGDSERFKQAVAQAGPVEEVQFFSGGGDLEEGLQIGRIMRANGLVSHIPAKFLCASACNFMFLGGIARSVDPSGQFMVHMFDRSNVPNVILAMLAQARAQADAAVRTQQAEAGARAPAQGSVQAKPSPRSSDGIAMGAPDSSKPAPLPDPQAQPPAQAPAPTPAPTPARVQGPSIGQFLHELNCPDQTQLEPDNLDREIVALLNKSGIQDPLERASFGVSLETMTLISRCIEQDDARTAAEIARFLVDMRLSLRFLTTFAAIPNAHARALTRDELRDFNIVNTE